MSDNTKQSAAETAKVLAALPKDTQEMAVRLAETYATGLATGMELAAGRREED